MSISTPRKIRPRGPFEAMIQPAGYCCEHEYHRSNYHFQVKHQARALGIKPDTLKHRRKKYRGGEILPCRLCPTSDSKKRPLRQLQFLADSEEN